METQVSSLSEAEMLKKENDTLRKRIRALEAEVARMAAKLIGMWGEA